MKRIFAITFSAIACSGCMPWIVQKTPTVLGNVETEGHPVSHAELYVIEGWLEAACHTDAATAATEANGSFVVEGTKGLGAIGYGDYVSGFTLCVRSNGAWYVGYHEGGMGYSVPKVVTLSCVISEGSSKGHSVCRR
jgi:hypothetical protein